MRMPCRGGDLRMSSMLSIVKVRSEMAPYKAFTPHVQLTKQKDEELKVHNVEKASRLIWKGI